MEDKKTEKPRCFVMMPFSDPAGYEDGHFNMVYEDLIKPAVEQAGFKPYRVDDDMASRDIVVKIIEAATSCEMALCDLSVNNANVSYELGIRHSFDLPVALIKDDDTRHMFDIQGIATLQYRKSLLHRNVEEDREKIADVIKQTYENPHASSVIRAANKEQAKMLMQASEPANKQEAMLQLVLDEMEHLRASFSSSERKSEIQNDDKFSYPFMLSLISGNINAITKYINSKPADLIDMAKKLDEHRGKYESSMEILVNRPISFEEIKAVTELQTALNQYKRLIETLQKRMK